VRFLPHSKLKESLANILKNEGYVRDVATGTDERGHKTVLVTMKYVDSAPVITASSVRPPRVAASIPATPRFPASSTAWASRSFPPPRVS